MYPRLAQKLPFSQGLLIILFLLPELWECRCSPPCLAHELIALKPCTKPWKEEVCMLGEDTLEGLDPRRWVEDLAG